MRCGRSVSGHLIQYSRISALIVPRKCYLDSTWSSLATDHFPARLKSGGGTWWCCPSGESETDIHAFLHFLGYAACVLHLIALCENWRRLTICSFALSAVLCLLTDFKVCCNYIFFDCTCRNKMTYFVQHELHNVISPVRENCWYVTVACDSARVATIIPWVRRGWG